MAYLVGQITKKERMKFPYLTNYLGVLEVSDYVSKVRFKKFSNPIWRIQYDRPRKEIK